MASSLNSEMRFFISGRRQGYTRNLQGERALELLHAFAWSWPPPGTITLASSLIPARFDLEPDGFLR